MRKSELKRTGFKPRTEPMRPKAGVKRPGKRRPIPARNVARAAKKFTRNFHSKEFCEFTSMQPCQTCGQAPIQWGPQYGDKWGSEVSHVDARGMGGCGGDWRKGCAQCPPCARAYEAAKKTWPKLNGHDMHKLAQEHIARFVEHCRTRRIFPELWSDAA